MSLKTLTVVAFFMCLLLNSCQKEKLTTVVDTPTIPAQAAITQDMASMQKTFRRVERIFAALRTGTVSFKNGSEYDISSCATINTDSISMPRVTVINYGLTGCIGEDGVTRKGKVTITYDGDLLEAGTTVVTKFSHYYEDDNEVTGFDSLHNEGLNANGHINYTMASDYEVILANNAGTEKDVFIGNYEWLNGESTETEDDDQFAFTSGTSSITAVNGEMKIFSVTSPVVKNLTPGCSIHFIQGSMLVQQIGGPVDYVVDYGDGTCDDIATATADGQTITVTLN